MLKRLAIGQLWLVGLVSQKIAVFISNSFYLVFNPILALVGKLGQSKDSRGHLKLILCCCLPDVIPHIKFHPNRMKNTEVPIFEISLHQNFFEKTAEAKLSKLEPFAWSHWIWNCLNYFQCKCQHQAHKDHKMAQLSRIASSENWKP